MCGCMEHSNRKLDITVEDRGLADVIKALAKLSTGKDIYGMDPFKRKENPMCLGWRLSADKTGIYISLEFEENIPGLDEPGWNKVKTGLRANKMANIVRRELKHVPLPESDCDGLTSDGWRLMEPMGIALEHERESDEFTSAFIYITRYTCEYSK